MVENAPSRPQSRERSGFLPVYPMPYLHIQVAFASKWAEITGEPIAKVAQEQTALHRILVNENPGQTPDPLWQAASQRLMSPGSAESRAHGLYGMYLEQPHSAYVSPWEWVPNYFAGPSYVVDGQGDIQLHFSNPDRMDPNPLSEEKVQQQIANHTRMYEDIREKHPDAQYVYGGGWTLSNHQIRRFHPPIVIEQGEVLRPPRLKMSGDSLWGQFLRSGGEINDRRAATFLETVDAASTTEDLLAAFPKDVIFFRLPIQHFYQHYGIK